MTKIKNFRINLRTREVARWLKNRQGVSVTPELEASIDQGIRESKALLETAALYTTLNRQTAAKTLPIELPRSVTAVSIIAATVGPKLEEARAAAEAQQNSAEAWLHAALQEEALNQTVHFAVRLIQEQAKEEECEMSSPVPAQDASLLLPLAALLGIQRIAIPFDVNSPSLPSYSRLVWTLWTPIAKSSSRRSDSVRVEKEKVSAV